MVHTLINLKGNLYELPLNLEVFCFFVFKLKAHEKCVKRKKKWDTIGHWQQRQLVLINRLQIKRIMVEKSGIFNHNANAHRKFFEIAI